MATAELPSADAPSQCEHRTVVRVGSSASDGIDILGLTKPISNIDTIFHEIDVALNRDNPPALEYLFFEPYTSFVIFRNLLSIGVRPFGHSALRYTLPNGQQILVNVTKKEGCKLVEIWDPVDFLYGIGEASREQGGIYSRHVVSIRIESLPAAQIHALHNYFVSVRQAVENHEAAFSTVLGPLLNLTRRCFPSPERGNCARWISKGLVEAGVMSRYRMFPKDIFVRLWKENKGERGNGNVNVVWYQRIEHAWHRYGQQWRNNHGFSFVTLSPKGLMRTVKYLHLHHLANVMVQVPANSSRAEVRVLKRDGQSESSTTLNYEEPNTEPSLSEPARKAPKKKDKKPLSNVLV
ncbi:hypothetical protein SpCBS45565_g07322 [Spizellomyces sp. 'palustris']|nr:hypothetical protein SpCBS45565_g07322 [Spizellomyces sp. 'palustris']